MLTPYQFASNRPIDGIDLDGLEYLPFHSSMYRLGYTTETTETPRPDGTICKMSSSQTVVRSVYQNIPERLKNPSTQDFKTVFGGPVGTDGHDYSGTSIYPSGRYHAPQPAFWGLGEGTTDGSSGTGNYSVEDGFSSSDSRGQIPKSGGDAFESNQVQSDRIASGGYAVQHATGMIGNWSNKFLLDALDKEFNARASFYYSTQMVDVNNSEGRWGKKLSPLERTHLINFMTDGTLFTDEINSKSWTLTGLTNALDIAVIGVQALNTIRNGALFQEATKKNISSLIQTYKQMGGEKTRYTNLETSIKPSVKKK